MRPFQYKKPLNTGDCRNRIIIEQPEVIKDDLNQEIETGNWQEVKKDMGNDQNGKKVRSTLKLQLHSLQEFIGL